MYVFPETKGFLFALQDEVNPLHSCPKYIIKDPNVMTDVCHLCGFPSETKQNVIVSCPDLAQLNYKHWHDQIAKVFHQELVKQHLLEEPCSPYYKYELQVVLENDNYKLYSDRNLLTNKTAPFNQLEYHWLIKQIRKLHSLTQQFY